MSFTLYVVKTHPVVHLQVLLMILGGAKVNFVPNKERKYSGKGKDTCVRQMASSLLDCYFFMFCLVKF